MYTWYFSVVNPFRTAVPLRRQASQIVSNLFPKRDCGTERVTATRPREARGAIDLRIGPRRVPVPCDSFFLHCNVVTRTPIPTLPSHHNKQRPSMYNRRFLSSFFPSEVPTGFSLLSSRLPSPVLLLFFIFLLRQHALRELSA